MPDVSAFHLNKVKGLKFCFGLTCYRTSYRLNLSRSGFQPVLSIYKYISNPDYNTINIYAITTPN
jgi:hypothetical protein